MPSLARAPPHPGPVRRPARRRRRFGRGAARRDLRDRAMGRGRRADATPRRVEERHCPGPPLHRPRPRRRQGKSAALARKLPCGLTAYNQTYYHHNYDGSHPTYAAHERAAEPVPFQCGRHSDAKTAGAAYKTVPADLRVDHGRGACGKRHRSARTGGARPHRRRPGHRAVASRGGSGHRPHQRRADLRPLGEEGAHPAPRQRHRPARPPAPPHGAR